MWQKIKRVGIIVGVVLGIVFIIIQIILNRKSDGLKTELAKKQQKLKDTIQSNQEKINVNQQKIDEEKKRLALLAEREEILNKELARMQNRTPEQILAELKEVEVRR